MRINIYNTIKDNGLPMLIKEKAVNYQSGKLSSPLSVTNMLNTVFLADKQTEEHTYMVCLKTNNAPLGVFEISHGNINTSICNNREIFMKALLLNASAIIIAHNHPSGDATMSKADISVYQKIKEAGQIMNLPLVDFIIIGENEYVSFNELQQEGINILL